MKGIIYLCTFPDEKVYVGQTRRSLEKRMREHEDSKIGPTNSGFWEAFQRFKNYKCEVIYEVEDMDIDNLVNKLNKAETFFIHKFKADNPQYGYNKKNFATVGTKTNAIIKRKLQEKTKEFYDKRMIVLDSATDKIWKTKEPLTQEELYLITSKYSDQNPFYEFIKDYDFVSLKNNNSDEDTIFILEEYIDFIQKMLYSEAEDESINYIRENYYSILHDSNSQNAIVQIDKDGNIIKEFYSYNEICQAFNVARADNVKNVLKGKQKSAYGYFWKYKKDLE